MASIAIALDDVGLAVRLQEILEEAGHTVQWDVKLAGGPHDDLAHSHDVILLRSSGDATSEAVARWRGRDSPPAVLLIGQSSADRTLADELRATYVDAVAAEREIAGAIERSMAYRHAAHMSRPYARSACGIGAVDDEVQDSMRIIRGSRSVAVELVVEALRPHIYHYATAHADAIKLLRHHRALEIPEVEFTHLLDGARTVHSVVNSGAIDPARAGRALWALVSIGAVTLSPEPVDQSTIKRRAVTALRAHIRARHARLMKATAYDVLEVSRGATVDQLDRAFEMCEVRYAPKRLESIDLGDLRSMVQPLWEQIVKAHAILRDGAQRAQYDQMLDSRGGELSVWASGKGASDAAETFYNRGQRALVDGDAFKAVSELAAACRAFGDHPVYEVALAWTRYRAELVRGKDPAEVAPKERAAAEGMLAGRRPWARALVPLAMLCAADNDPEAARWHLREALACDPRLPAARRLLARLTK